MNPEAHARYLSTLAVGRCLDRVKIIVLFIVFNSLHASGEFCRVLITSVQKLDPGQARRFFFVCFLFKQSRLIRIQTV